jgi:hypothetical protein
MELNSCSRELRFNTIAERTRCESASVLFKSAPRLSESDKILMAVRDQSACNEDRGTVEKGKTAPRYGPAVLANSVGAKTAKDETTKLARPPSVVVAVVVVGTAVAMDDLRCHWQ